jgi:hypothetical protein
MVKSRFPRCDDDDDDDGGEKGHEYTVVESYLAVGANVRCRAASMVLAMLPCGGCGIHRRRAAPPRSGKRTGSGGRM